MRRACAIGDSGTNPGLARANSGPGDVGEGAYSGVGGGACGGAGLAKLECDHVREMLLLEDAAEDSDGGSDGGGGSMVLAVTVEAATA